MSVARRVRRKNTRCFRSASKKKRAERGAAFLKRLGGTQSAQGARNAACAAFTTGLLCHRLDDDNSLSTNTTRGHFYCPLTKLSQSLDDSDVAKYTQTALRRSKLPNAAWAFEREGERCLQSNSFKPVQLC